MTSAQEAERPKRDGAAQDTAAGRGAAQDGAALGGAAQHGLGGGTQTTEQAGAPNEPQAAVPPEVERARRYLDLWERNLAYLALHGPLPDPPAPGRTRRSAPRRREPKRRS